MLLVEVSRLETIPIYAEALERDVDVFYTEKYAGEGPVLKKGVFFHVNDRDVDKLMEALAKENPGCDINVYRLEKVGHCPAAEYVTKQVTKNGTLPF
jgi:hypothetical protein